jgi:hypothetical protein
MKYPLPPGVFKALDTARRKNVRDRMESRDEAAIGLLDSPGGPAERSVSEDKALREFLLSTIAPPDVISVCKNPVKAGLLLTGRVFR